MVKGQFRPVHQGTTARTSGIYMHGRNRYDTRRLLYIPLLFSTPPTLNPWRARYCILSLRPTISCGWSRALSLRLSSYWWGPSLVASGRVSSIQSINLAEQEINKSAQETLPSHTLPFPHKMMMQLSPPSGGLADWTKAWKSRRRIILVLGTANHLCLSPPGLRSVSLPN